MRPPGRRDPIAMTLAAARAQAPAAGTHDRRSATQDERQALRQRSVHVIHEGLRLLGAADPAALEDEAGFVHYPVGSIQCTMGIVAVDDRDLFVVYARIMDLPSDRDLILPLYRLLLELNNRFELSIAKFGLHGDTVFLSAMRHLEGLDPSEVEDMVRWVSEFADDMDDRLLVEFGGTSKPRPA